MKNSKIETKDKNKENNNELNIKSVKGEKKII